MNMRKIAALVLLVLMAFPLCAQADGFSIPAYSMDVAIREDVPRGWLKT
jgi:hypothetical protein